MSDGPFLKTRYEDDDAGVRPILVQPESITTWNPAATGSITGDMLRVSGSNKRIGRRARSVTLKRLVGPVTEGAQAFKLTTIPVLTPAGYAAISPGSDVEYNGETWVVATKTKEGGRIE